MSLWNGYDQHPDAHEERPWWRLLRREVLMSGDVDEDWERSDGGLCGAVDCPNEHERTAMLARYDAAHPLPAPEPRCGQVWVWSDASPWRGLEMTVVAVTGAGVFFGGRADPWAGSWPPPSAVLVAGPGAPWAPT